VRFDIDGDYSEDEKQTRRCDQATRISGVEVCPTSKVLPMAVAMLLRSNESPASDC
jgi:hypothetical protein